MSLPLTRNTFLPLAPTLQELSNELETIENWHLLGVKLGLQGHQLREIEQDHPRDSKRRKNEMLDIWLRSSKNPTWEAVVKAVRLMQEQVVADGILTKYCCSFTVTSK